MKTISIAVLLLVALAIDVRAADSTSVEQDTVNLSAAMNSIFAPLNMSRVETDILIDKIFPFQNPRSYAGVSGDSTGTLEIWEQLLYQFRQASVVLPAAIVHPDTARARSAYYEGQGTVPIVMMYVQYNAIKLTAVDDSLLYWSNNQLYDSPGTISPYDTRATFSAVPTLGVHDGQTVEFTIDPQLYFSNTTTAVDSLQIDFDDGNGYQTVTWGTVQVVYSTAGTKQILVKMVNADGAFVAKSMLEVLEDESMFSIFSSFELPYSFNLTADRSYAGGTASGSATVYLGCGHTSIVKPFIIVEGFDPNNEFDAFEIAWFFNSWQRGDQFIDKLRDRGYDIVILDFANGGDYIQRNAYLLQKLIQEMNTQKTSDHELVVMGLSMGGLVARYALADMEDNNVDHQTRMYISMDSPHQGAFIPTGLQYLARYYNDEFADYINNRSLKNNITALESPAAKQMLVEYLCLVMGIRWPCLTTERNTLLSELATLGYPQKTRNIAVSNGSVNGTGQGYNPNDQYFKLRVKDYDLGFLGATLDVENDLWANPDYSQGVRVVVDLFFDMPWPVGNKELVVRAGWASPYGRSDEVLPGGYLNSNKQLVDGVNGTFPGSSENFGRDNHCFISTVSALDIAYTNHPHEYAVSNVASLLNSNTITTPFDAWYGIADNTSHVLLRAENNSTIRTALHDMLEDILSTELPDILFLQNETIAAPRTFDLEARTRIEAGYNVTSTIPVGNYVVESGADVELRAGSEILMKNGFHAKAGSAFHAYIEPFSICAGFVPVPLRQNTNSSAEEQTVGVPGIEQQSQLELQAFPNPFTHSTRFVYRVEEPGAVSLVVSDMYGQTVAEPIRQHYHAAGMYEVNLDASNLPAGMYMCTLRSGGRVVVLKIVQVK